MITTSEAIRWRPEPEKTDGLCEEQVGVRDYESSDRIKGCDGTCVHAVGSLAGAGGWSITNVTAFPICTGASLLKAPPPPPSETSGERLEQNLLTLPFGTVNVQPYG